MWGGGVLFGVAMYFGGASGMSSEGSAVPRGGEQCVGLSAPKVSSGGVSRIVCGTVLL